jgi:hypothetical protein
MESPETIQVVIREEQIVREKIKNKTKNKTPVLQVRLQTYLESL